MTPEHLQANHRLDQITRAIREHELALEGLYHRRAGCVRWAADDLPVFGYCVVCGRDTVKPADGFDTCPKCVRTRA